jgi:hypothetical protein
VVRENNVYRWARSLIGELAGIRLEQRHTPLPKSTPSEIQPRIAIPVGGASSFGPDTDRSHDREGVVYAESSDVTEAYQPQ